MSPHLTAVLLASILLVINLITTVNTHEYNENGWKLASEFLRTNINSKKDPCRDFWGYACGKWMNGPAHDVNDSDAEAEIKLRDLLISALDKIDLSNNASLPYYKEQIRIIYDQCLNMPVMNDTQLIVATWKAIFDVMSRWMTKTHVELLEKIRQQNIMALTGWLEHFFYGGEFLFETAVDWAPVNCTQKLVLKLAPPSTLKLKEEEIVEMLMIVTPSEREDNLAFARNVTEFANKLANLVKQRDEKKGQGAEADDVALVKKSELTAKYPNLDIDAYFEGLFPGVIYYYYSQWNETDPYILMIGDHYFKELPQLLSQYGYNIVLNYIACKMYSHVKDYYDATTETASAISTEKKHFCYGILKQFAPAALARTAFDALGADILEWRRDIEILAENVFSAFRIFVSGQDWLDSDDKMKIVDRINNIRLDTGMPLWLADGFEVNRRTLHFDPEKSILYNVFSSLRQKFREVFFPVIKPEEKTSEDEMPQLHSDSFVPHAYYSYGKIYLTLAQVLPPFYHHHYPLAVKFGMLGWSIAHQLMHAFDEGSLLGAAGEGEDPLEIREEAKKLFKQRTHCMVKQYSSYCYRAKGGQCISGAKTADENIGDIEGLKIAYMAYKFVTQIMGSEPPMPELVRLKNDQAFFVSAAQLYCGKEGDYKADSIYPPKKVRIEQAMRNFPVFAKTFRCRKGSKFAPIRTCSLWGRFVAPNQCVAGDVFSR